MIYLRFLLLSGLVIITKANLEPELSNQPKPSVIPVSVVKPAVIAVPAVQPSVIGEPKPVQRSIIAEQKPVQTLIIAEPKPVQPSIIAEPKSVQPSIIGEPKLVQPSIIAEPIESADNKNTDKPNTATPTPTPAELNTIDKIITNLNLTDLDDIGWEYENRTPIDTRRILFSSRSKPGKRAYMVYLQLTPKSAKAAKYRGWLCGGVVVHKNYVLTSAACVQDADRFYVVSGTTKYVDSSNYKNDDCVCKHRRKVIWKCIPKNYKFDFQDSKKWSSNDIAVVKVNKPFCFDEVEKGCEYAVKKVCYNNVSRDLEKPGTKAWIAGWGSNGGFREGVYRRDDSVAPKNAKCLQEAKVCIMDNARCAQKWAKKFRDIIKEYMVCTKDIIKQMSEVCNKKYANCTYVEAGNRRQANVMLEPPPKSSSAIDFGRHLRDPMDYSARRFTSAGFCENDHGGPLIVKYADRDRVIGVISACKIDPKSHSCHGPFLYTSVFVNRQFISCAINKDIEGCKRVFRAGVTHEETPVNWEGEEDDEGKGTRTESPDDNKADKEDNDKEDEDDKENNRKDKDDDDDNGTKKDSKGKNKEDDDDDDKDDKDDPGPPPGPATESSIETYALREGNRDDNSTSEPNTPEPDIKTGQLEPLKANV